MLSLARFLSSPFIIRVPFFLLFGFNKETPNKKGQKGNTQEPSWAQGSGLGLARPQSPNQPANQILLDTATLPDLAVALHGGGALFIWLQGLNCTAYGYYGRVLLLGCRVRRCSLQDVFLWQVKGTISKVTLSTNV